MLGVVSVPTYPRIALCMRCEWQLTTYYPMHAMWVAADNNGCSHRLITTCTQTPRVFARVWAHLSVSFYFFLSPLLLCLSVFLPVSPSLSLPLYLCVSVIWGRLTLTTFLVTIQILSLAWAVEIIFNYFHLNTEDRMMHHFQRGLCGCVRLWD